MYIVMFCHIVLIKTQFCQTLNTVSKLYTQEFSTFLFANLITFLQHQVRRTE